MDIMELGAIEELVGGVAVVASLLYVGVQVRQNSTQLRQGNEIERSAAAREFSQGLNQIQTELMQPVRLEALRRGLAGFERLDKDNVAIAHLLLSSLMVLGNTQTYLGEQSLADQAIVAGFNGFTARVLRTPGGSEWWRKWGPTFHNAFYEATNEVIASQEREGATSLLKLAPWYAADESERGV